MTVHVLVTGATGYVGGRLVPRLLDAGHAVRVLVRDPARLDGRGWAGRVEAVRGDVTDPASLDAALAGQEAAYYLVPAQDDPQDPAVRGGRAAEAFGAAAGRAGLRRIVFLGHLADERAAQLDPQEPGQGIGGALGSGGVPVTGFHAGAIVGSGSILFEMVRYLAERQPVLLCPAWTRRRLQPIAVRDVLTYLVAALEVEASAGRSVELGGPEQLGFEELLRAYARLRGLRRLMAPVPVTAAELSSHWVHWMTPVPVGLARPLVEGMCRDVVLRDDQARRLFPAVAPLPFVEACRLALERTERGDTETRWTDALWTSAGDERPVTFQSEQGLELERRRLTVRATPEAVYRVFCGLGGERGWLYADWTWRLRGLMDRAVGGVGLRRGRRDPDQLRVGDAVDFWRVEAAEPPRLLRLRAEMKVPGLAWLQFEARPVVGGTLLVQTAFFEPHGLPGLAYWYGSYPFHRFIFTNMIARIGALAERADPGLDEPLRDLPHSR